MTPDYKAMAEDLWHKLGMAGLYHYALKDVTAALRSCGEAEYLRGKIEAYGDAEKRAQIEVNACRSHAKASRYDRTSTKSLHTAAANVADVIASFCRDRAAALRQSADTKEKS